MGEQGGVPRMTYQTKKELRRRNARQEQALIDQTKRISELSDTLGERESELRAAKMQVDIYDRAGQHVARHADSLQAKLDDRTQDLRLAVLQNSGWSAIEEIDARAKWVLEGTVPERRTSDESAKDVPTEAAEAPSLGFSTIRPDDLADVLISLQAVDRILDHVRKDPYLSVGKVRIQNAGIKLKGVLLDLRQVMGS